MPGSRHRNQILDGGLGADGYNVIYGVPVAAQQANTVVKLTFNGEGGDDAAFVKLIGSLPSNAQTLIDLEGGTGNDSLFVRYENGIENGFVSLLVNGGTGTDTAHFTSTVAVAAVENLVPVS